MCDQKVSPALDRIRNLKGMEELKQLIDEWQVVSQNLNRLPGSTRVKLPNCLLATQSGSGITKVLGLVAQFLEEAGLFEFVGDIKYFEFVLDRPADADSFPSFTRLMEYIQAAAGFRGTYRGLACIDISEWAENPHDVRFIRFLEYVSDINDRILFIFNIPLLDEKRIEEIDAVLLSYLRIRRLKLTFPESEALFRHVDEVLREKGFSLAEEAGALLKKTIASAREMPGFDGYNTLNQMVDEIIYDKCCSSILYDNIIAVKDLGHFSPGGYWLSQLNKYKALPKKMGFMIDGR
ncbi:hypothetical protein ACOBQJ_15325 [Pelotomaculum propionicicum]|uniref:hypothetical protein n=1 Tax=Pelotomaculum propionicicum TaxID=258475 RepID=UPI003B773C4C